MYTCMCTYICICECAFTQDDLNNKYSYMCTSPEVRQFTGSRDSDVKLQKLPVSLRVRR